MQIAPSKYVILPVAIHEVFPLCRNMFCEKSFTTWMY